MNKVNRKILAETLGAFIDELREKQGDHYMHNENIPGTQQTRGWLLSTLHRELTEKPTECSEPPTADFEIALTSSGGISRECEFCGRTYFDDSATGGWDWEKGEREALEARAQKEPDRCIAVEKVSSGTLDGQEFVIGCKCNAATRYERFIYNHNYLIRDYFERLLNAKRILLDEHKTISQAEIDRQLQVMGVAVKAIGEINNIEYTIEAESHSRELRETYQKRNPPGPDHCGSIYLRSIRGYGNSYDEKAARLKERGFVLMRSEPAVEEDAWPKIGPKRPTYWETWWVTPFMARGDLQGKTLEDIRAWSLKQSFGEVEIARERWGLSPD